jgi:tetratricopeptide (TPR) repeat protein
MERNGTWRFQSAVLAIALIATAGCRSKQPAAELGDDAAAPTSRQTQTALPAPQPPADAPHAGPLAADQSHAELDIDDPPAQRTGQDRTYVERATALLDQGDVASALELLNTAIRENPDLIEAHLAIGDIHRKQGDYERAVLAYERATIVDPASFDAHYFLGLMLQLMGKLAESINSYLFALAIEPDSFDANHHLATVYLQLGRPAEAVPYARKSTEINYQHQGAWANLAVAYSMMRLYEKAVDAYRQAAELGELAEPILLGLADAHIKLKNYDRALAVLQQQTRQMPSAIAFERLGYAQFKLQHLDLASTNFRAALLYDANHAAALNGLGVALMTQYVQSNRRTPAKRDEALALWNKSLQLRPGQPKIYRLIEEFHRW